MLPRPRSPTPAAITLALEDGRSALCPVAASRLADPPADAIAFGNAPDPAPRSIGSRSVQPQKGTIFLFCPAGAVGADTSRPLQPCKHHHYTQAGQEMEILRISTEPGAVRLLTTLPGAPRPTVPPRLGHCFASTVRHYAGTHPGRRRPGLFHIPSRRIRNRIGAAGQGSAT